MNKFIIGFLFSITILPSLAYAPPAIIQVHDMQMINDQRFRREVINDYNDVKQEKERFEKRNKPFKPTIENTVIKAEPELIQEGGEVKIKYEN